MNWGFHPDARAEFHDAAVWYERQREGLGGEFVAEVHETVARVLQNPGVWRKVRGDTRWCLTHRFPFAIVYRLRAGNIENLAVMHLSRKPDYWRSRMSGGAV